MAIGGDSAGKRTDHEIKCLVARLFDAPSIHGLAALQARKVDYYRRPLTVIAEDLYSTGFWIERLLEPQPTADFKRVDPAGYERLIRSSWFLFIRARNKGRLDVSR